MCLIHLVWELQGINSLVNRQNYMSSAYKIWITERITGRVYTQSGLQTRLYALGP